MGRGYRIGQDGKIGRAYRIGQDATIRQRYRIGQDRTIRRDGRDKSGPYGEAINRWQIGTREIWAYA